MKNHWFNIFFPIFILACLFGSNFALGAEENVVAYYFYGNFRCPTCHKMEQYSKEAIENNFKDELASGELVFKAINTEEKGNEHFVEEYQLYTKSLVISLVRVDNEIKHKNLKKIWEYARDKNKFIDYVTEEIRDYLKQ